MIIQKLHHEYMSQQHLLAVMVELWQVVTGGPQSQGRVMMMVEGGQHLVPGRQNVQRGGEVRLYISTRPCFIHVNLCK